MSRPIRLFAMFLLMPVISLAIFGRPSARAGSSSGADPSSEAQIRALLDVQTAAWNRGDVEAFMAGYWKSDETEFVGASGISRGWQALLDRYRKSYPDRNAMGRLTFSGLEIHVICPEAAFAIGQYQLEREHDRPSGIFTLNFRRFHEGWRIVADHTTEFAAASSAKSP
ncbi:MAG: nuclear transport factor 2 family protein [Candidatus Acidiferrales bacterium]